MKILVPIKRVIDPYVKIRVKSDHTGVEFANVKMAMNPFDEIAVEEAVKIKEQHPDRNVQVVLVSIGNLQVQETLRNGLAMGADSAIHIQTDHNLQSLTIAKVLKQVVLQQNPELVILGKQAIDNDNNQTGQMLAALLGWPQATFASKLVLEQNTVSVTREVDGGMETLKLTLPGIVTTDLRLNQPRYATLPNIMKAKSKPMQVIPFESFAINPQSTLTIVSVATPPERKAGVILNSVAELIDKLKNEEQVL